MDEREREHQISVAGVKVEARSPVKIKQFSDSPADHFLRIFISTMLEGDGWATQIHTSAIGAMAL